MSSKIEVAHNAARILQNLGSSHLSKDTRSECAAAAHEIYKEFGEPSAPITSAGGNYFDLAAPVVERQTVAYLDIGAGGYIDLGSDLTDEQMQALPNGRHMLGIVGTYGIDGWEPALAFSTSNPDPVAYATFDDDGKIKIWSRSAKIVEDITRRGEKAIPLYTAPPELAELQATIAKLRNSPDDGVDFGFDDRSVRVSQEAYSIFIAREAHYQAAIAKLKSDIERLKDGQGERISFPRELGDGLAELIATKARVCGGGAFDIWEEICEQFGTSQPAPVSSELVQLLERAKVYARGPFLDEINACLDKVKELNQ